MKDILLLTTGVQTESVTAVLNVSIWILIITGAAVFLAGLITKNYSHVDRLWSVLPPVYAVIWGTAFYRYPVFLIPAVLVLLWGARLTFNFARRGGYAFSIRKGFTGEDYRWPILREKIGNRFLFELFNLVFITGFQLILIFLFSLPLFLTGVEAMQGNIILSWFHLLLALAFLFFLWGETIADNQQYWFQEAKKSKDFSLDFNTYGLWQYSRHPNYACELLQWVTIALYAIVSGADPILAGLGAVLLIILFAGSTKMTENVTLSKYPEYREWQKITSPWVPGYKTFFRKNDMPDYISG